MINIKNFTIIRSYEMEDKDFDYDTMEVRLIDNETNKLIMSGDYYHDKIDDKIKGFFECFNYLGIEYKIETKKINEDW